MFDSKEEINQLQAMQERRLTVGDLAHLATISQFSKAVRSRLESTSKGPDLLESASNVYAVFWEYNAIRAIRTKLGQEIKKHTIDVSWGTHIDHFQTLE